MSLDATCTWLMHMGHARCASSRHRQDIVKTSSRHRESSCSMHMPYLRCLFLIQHVSASCLMPHGSCKMPDASCKMAMVMEKAMPMRMPIRKRMRTRIACWLLRSTALLPTQRNATQRYAISFVCQPNSFPLSDPSLACPRLPLRMDFLNWNVCPRKTPTHPHSPTIYRHAHTHTHTHTNIHTHIHTHTHKHAHSHLHLHLHLHTLMQTHVHILIREQIHIHTHIHTHSHTHASSDIEEGAGILILHTHAHTIHTHAHT